MRGITFPVRSLFVLALAASLGSAFAISQIAWDPAGFDAFGEDEGYIDFALDEDTLVVTFDDEEGAIPATMEGDALPLADLDEDRLRDPNSLALYGGLPIDVGPNYVTVELDGEPQVIDEAIMSRLSDLGLQTEEIETTERVFHLWRLTSGENAWQLSLSHVGGGTLMYLRAVR